MNTRHDTNRIDSASPIRASGGRLAGGSRSPGFTLLELLLVAAILAVAIALVISAFAGSAKFVRDRATELQLRSLDVAVQQFEKDYGFLPPLIDSGNNGPTGSRLVDYDRTVDESYSGFEFDVVARYLNPPPRPAAPTGRLRVPGYAEFDAGEEEAINRYLRYESFAANDGLSPRYSFLTLGSYLLGTLPKEVDGGAENLMGRPTPDGRFDESREKRPPTMDAASLTDNRLVRRRSFSTANVPTVIPPNNTLSIIVDRNLLSIRYYRWEPLYHTADSALVVAGRPGAPANDAARASAETGRGLVRDENVPYVLGYSKYINVNGAPLSDLNSNSPQAREALRRGQPYQTLSTQRYAIVAAGPDIKFGGGTNEFNPVNGVRDAKDNLVISAGNLVSPEDTR
jgi:prepilin-type N-terminal cleavage/methylation domain-containing protein